MQVNEFENQVREKMASLNLRPSGEVWNSVELRIRKEKKKRRIIFWLPASVALTGIVVYLFLNSTIQHRDEISQPVTVSPGLKKENKIIVDPAPPASLNSKNPFTYKSADVNFHFPAVSSSFESNRLEIQVKSPEKSSRKTVATHSEITMQNIDSVSLANTGKEEIKTDESNDQEKNKKARPIERKWKFGVLAGGGISSQGEGIRLFQGNRDGLNYGMPSSQNPGVPPIPQEIEMKPSLSFSIGIIAQRDFGKRFYAGGKMGINFLQTIYRTGTRQQGSRVINNNYSNTMSVDEVYRPGGSEKYSNRYVFLEAGAIAGMKLNPSAKYPASFELSPSYARLVNTNSLIYDQSIPGFYKDPEAFNRNQVFIAASVNVKMPLIKNADIYLAPFAEFSPTRVYKNTNAEKRKYSNAGMRLKILF